MFLSIDELKTHLYNENMSVITQDDDTIVTAAIDGAVSEAKGYLSAYDTDKIFSARGEDRNGLLLIFVKDIAVWHFMTLCNLGADLDFRRFRYERAVDWLKQVQRGNVSPDLPLIDKDEDGKPDHGEYLFGSNPKRNQRF